MRTHHLFLGVALLFVTSAPAFAAKSTLDLIASAPRYTVSDVALSPDGKYVAYIRQRISEGIYESPTVWFVSATGGTPEQLTYGDIGSLEGVRVRWTTDSRGVSVFAFSDPFHRSKPGQGSLRVWTFDIKTRRSTSLGTGSILPQDFAWAPDGKRIAVVGMPFDLQAATRLAQTMRAGSISALPTPGPAWPLPQQAQPSKGFYGFGALPKLPGTGSMALFIIGDNSAKPTRISSSSQGVVPIEPEWSANGRRMSIVTLGAPRPGQQIPEARIVEYDVATRTIVWRSGPSCFSSAFVSPTSVAYACSVGDPNASLADIFEGPNDVSRSIGLSCQSTFGFPRIASTSDGSIVVPFADGSANRLYLRSEGGWRPLTSPQQDILAFSTAPSAREIAYAAGTPYGLSIFVTGEKPGTVARKIATLPDEIAVVGAYKTEVVHWKSDDGRLLNGLVVLPHHDTRGAPLIVDVHGGPQANWTVEPDIDADYFASLGYVVFKPNPRGSTGYGSWSFASITGDWADGPMHDVLAGVDSIEHAGYGGGREYLVGDSYGAYLVTWILEHSHKFSAAEAGFGLYSLPLQFALSDAPSEVRTYYGNRPSDRDAELVRQSPLTHVGELRTPLLMLAGRIDRRAPYSVTLLMFKTLAESGDPVRLIQFSSSGHGYDSSGGEAYALDQEARWFARFGGEAVAGKPL